LIIENTVLMGRFGRPIGLRGEIKLYSFSDPIKNILEYSPWYTLINNQTFTLEPKTAHERENFLVVCLKDVLDRTSVEKYVNKEIFVSRQSLPTPEEGQFYLCDLIGKKVINQEGDVLGTLTEFQHNNAHYLMYVENEHKKTILIPYTKEVITEINEDSIKVDWYHEI
tara:strand:+ start:974 stop:1477 length:504 start_codon:yes stop_codon:yes gene_type:complete